MSRVIDPTSSLFAKLKVYFEGGAHAVVLYAADNTPSSGYSDNYLFLDAVKIVITYEEGLVYLGINGVFQKCQVFMVVNGAWVQCIPYYGSGGVWNQCGG